MAESSSRRAVLIGLGALLVLAGLVAAVALWNVAGTRNTNAVEDLARAPVGCDTTLDFVEPGEYLVFVERSGTIDGVRGNCEVEGSYDLTGSRLPDVDVAIIDPDGNELDLDRVNSDVSYAEGEFVGEAIQTVDIEERNDHVIRVESDEADTFVVAIGRDPSDGVAAIRVGAIAAGIAGLLLGVGLILLGTRRSKATVPASAWAPGSPTAAGYPGQPPQGPPGYGQPGQQPQYPPQYPPQPYQQAPPYQQPAAPQQYPPQQPATPQQYPPQQPATPQQYPPQASPQPYHPPPHQQPPPPPAPPPAPSPFAPAAPQAPIDPAGSAQPIDWSPSGDTTPAVDPDDLDTAPPDADFIARIQSERDREPPPPN